MANIGALLKEEIVRLAKKESRAAVSVLKKQVATLAQEVRSLKRDMAELQREVKALSKRSARISEIPGAADAAGTGTSRERMTGAGIKTLRKRLGLSAAQMGFLVEASGQSVYKWEDGVKPRKAQMSKLIELRGKGKKEVAALLASEPVQRKKPVGRRQAKG